LRLALYAHHSSSGGLALYVLFYLRKLRDMGFEICFISNSPIPQAKERELHEICERVIQRENTGYDFAMWHRAIAEYEIPLFDELLLTNSSIVGPVHPLEPLWQNPATSQCDFWGLTDNDELGRHLQSYFIVFRRQVLEHPCFLEFWSSVLPLSDREQIIRRYEVGLTSWLEEHGFSWNALFPQEQIHALLVSRRGFAEKLKNGFRPPELPRNTVMLLPDLLLECGLPFLKTKLFSGEADMRWQVDADSAMRLLQNSNLPAEVVQELRMMAGDSRGKRNQYR